MMGTAQLMVMEAAVKAHREDLVHDMNRTNRVQRPGRVRWVQGLIDAVGGKHRDPRQGAIRWEGDGPMTRRPAPHHSTSH